MLTAASATSGGATMATHSASDQVSSKLPDRVDVVVVGAGLAGLAAAARLREGGASVVVVDGAERPGGGGSWGSPVGWLGLAEHPWRIAASLGDERAGEFYGFCRASLARWGGDASGGLWQPFDDRERDEIASSIAALERLHVPVRALGDGMWLPDERRVDLDGWRAANGSPVVYGARVGAFKRSEFGDLTVVTALGDVRCEVVVIANGFEARTLDAWFEERLFSYREQCVELAGGESVMTPPTRMQHGWVWMSSTARGAVVGGCRWATPHFEEGEVDPVVSSPVQARLDAMATAQLPGAEIVGRRAWVACKSSDGLPIVGPLPGAPRFVVCVGFHGNGAGLALGAGRGAADGILGYETGVPDFFAPSRLC